MGEPPRQRTPRLPVVLLGGPKDGQEVQATDDADTLLFHGDPGPGLMSVYVLTGLRTTDGRRVFSWSGTAPS